MGNLVLTLLKQIRNWSRLEILPPYNFGDNKLSGLSDGTAATDAATKGQVDNAVKLPEKIELILDGDGAALAQDASAYGKVPFACTIQEISLVSREAGATVEVDILKHQTFASLATITGTGTKPALSNAQSAVQTSFTNWTTVNLAAGDWIQAKVTTANPVAVKVLKVILKVVRT